VKNSQRFLENKAYNLGNVVKALYGTKEQRKNFQGNTEIMILPLLDSCTNGGGGGGGGRAPRNVFRV
jgi:hypothetical protein